MNNNFFCQTTLFFINKDLQDQLIKYAFENSENVTSRHGSLIDVGTARFTFFQLPIELTQQILDPLPSVFKSAELDPFIRLQLTSGNGPGPHIDQGRTSSLMTILTDDSSKSHFYDWAPGATKQLLQNMKVTNLDDLEQVESAVFEQGHTYLFNHSAIHDVVPMDKIRITLNVLYQKLPFAELVKIYNDHVLSTC